MKLAPKFHRIFIICVLIFMVLQFNAQVIAVDEYCISNTFAQNGSMNERPLYGPIAGIYIFWDESEEWVMGSLDKNYVYYTSQDNSPEPGCSTTFTWTAPANSECENIAVSGPACSVIVPVEYIYFKGGKEGNYNKLSWKTASELNNEGFEILRSKDGKEYTNIGFVNGKGTTSFSYEYAFIDRNVDKSLSYYYRLVQKDYDGHFEKSRVVYISGDRGGALVQKLIFNQSNVLLYSEENFTDVGLKLLDISGKVVFNGFVNLNKGENHIGMPDLPAGQYILSVEDSNHHAELHKVTKI